MLTKQTIITAVQGLLQGRFPEADVGRGDGPVEPGGAALVIQPTAAHSASVGRDLVEETLSLTILCRAATPKDGESGNQALDDLQGGVLALFRPGFLRVEDRAVKCEAAGSRDDAGLARVTVVCRYFEGRVQAPAPPTMREIHNNIQEG